MHVRGSSETANAEGRTNNCTLLPPKQELIVSHHPSWGRKVKTCKLRVPIKKKGKEKWSQLGEPAGAKSSILLEEIMFVIVVLLFI